MSSPYLASLFIAAGDVSADVQKMQIYTFYNKTGRYVPKLMYVTEMLKNGIYPISEKSIKLKQSVCTVKIISKIKRQICTFVNTEIQKISANL